MVEERARLVERIVDAVASALLALALLATGWKLGAGATRSGVIALIIGGFCWRGLRAIKPEAAIFPLPHFLPPELAPEELVLGEADRIDAPSELVLDDIAAHIGPGSRVVRLFDASAMPTPGELGARIDRHLDAVSRPSGPDASHDLFEALAQLRRSLR